MELLDAKTKTGKDGRRYSAYNAPRGVVYVCDSVKTGLLIIELLEDAELSEFEKYAVLMALLFEDPQAVEQEHKDCLGDLLAGILRGVFGFSDTGDPDPLFSWDEDANRIRASLLQAYGLKWADVLDGMSFTELIGLLADLAEQPERATTFSQAIYYRQAEPPKPTKYNREEVKAFKAAREFYALKGVAKRDPLDTGAVQNNKAAELFAALKTQSEVKKWQTEK